MIMTTVIAGLLTSAAVVVTLRRAIGVRRMVKHSTKIDVGFSVLLFWAFSGTVTGILTAVIAGLAMAIYLSFLKHMIEVKDKRVEAKAAAWAKWEGQVKERKSYSRTPKSFNVDKIEGNAV